MSNVLSRRRFVGLAAGAAAGAAASGTGLIGSRTAQAAPSGSGEVLSWINQHAVPMRSLEPDGPLFDLAPLRGIVGDARLVGVGYDAHGTHSLTTLHHRVIRFLVEHLGFRTVAWEESWGGGVEIDRYVRTGGGDPRAARDLVAGAFPIVRHEAFVEIVRWCSEFNAGRPEHDKVRFLGSDVLEVRQFLYDRVRRYVTDVAPERLGELNAHLEPLRMRGNPQETVIWYMDPKKTEKWRDEMVAHGRAMFDLVSGLPDAPSAVEYVDAVQDARNIFGFYHFNSWKGTLADVREVYIAETMKQWLRRVPNRTVYIAHNGHIAANPNMVISIPPVDMNRERVLSGAYFRRDYGSDYVGIGTCFGHGTIFVGWQTGPRDYDIPAPNPSFVDNTLGRAVAPNYLLDLNARGPRPDSVRRWLDGPAKLRLVASAYDPAKDFEYKQHIDPWRGVGFDAMFYVDEVETARMFGL
ncbi:erythromycin esterase family protein [Actinophytocola sp.]|uniref:erythromycin esterase family protein n=1 Tax=Actinophytocola sp. TaxID=1872138 RepID=UPI003D6A5955